MTQPSPGLRCLTPPPSPPPSPAGPEPAAGPEPTPGPQPATGRDRVAHLDAVLTALETALAGTGAPVLVLPPDAGQAARVRAALRPDEPVEVPGIAAVVATSGSTGEPKGALLPAAALRHSARATAHRLGGTGTWLLALPLHHVAGLQVAVRSLAAGTRPVPVDLSAGFTAAAFAAATRRLPATGRRYTSLVPTQLRRLLAAGGEAVDALGCYDAVLVGGAAAGQDLLARARSAGARVVTTYGMTETCGGCVYDGTPLAGVRTALTSDGRIRIGGPVLFAGYRLRADLTAAALRDGWYDTRDLGRIDDGRLTVLGRADDVVVSGGENVSLAAVERVLAEHPDVADAAAVGRADGEWGTRIVAVVVRHSGASTPLAPPEQRELRAYVVQRLGRAAAPVEVRVVAELPLAGPGKVDRAAVRTLAAAPAPRL